MGKDAGPVDIVATTANQLAVARPVLEKIVDKWTIMTLVVIYLQPARFNEIKRRLGCITHKALADALKRLGRNGLVTRTVLPTRPIGVEYAITPLGLFLRVPFGTLIDWAVARRADFEAACLVHDARRQER